MQRICEKIDDHYCCTSHISELATYALQYCLPEEKRRRLTKQLTPVTGVANCRNIIKHNLTILNGPRDKVPVSLSKKEIESNIHQMIQQSGWNCQRLDSFQAVKLAEFVACFRQDSVLMKQLMHVYANYYGPYHPRVEYKLWYWIGILLQQLFSLSTRKYSISGDLLDQARALFGVIFDLYRQAKLIHHFSHKPLKA